MLINRIVLSEALLGSFKQLFVHPLRTFLTIAGITIGIAALIAMMGIGEGTRQKVIHDMERIGGTGVLTVELRDTINEDPNRENIQRAKLTEEDVMAFQQASELLSGLAPTIQMPGIMYHKASSFDGLFLGTTPGYGEVRDWPLESGRFLAGIDLEYKNRVCVIGSAVKEQFFSEIEPIGKKIHFQDDEYTVVGVMVERNLEAGRWLNDLVLVPMTTVNATLLGKRGYSRILVKAKKMEHVPLIKEQVTRSIQARHANRDGIVIQSQVEVINSLERASMLMRFSFGSITLIVLMVGGIGIMNLMLVSVTERTREVGIHKAVGAHDIDILLFFLFESITLSILGGIIGIIMGIQGGNFLSFAIGKYLNNSVACIISTQSILLAVVFSVVIGIIFGLYPAMKAASIDPSKALSYE